MQDNFFDKFVKKNYNDKLEKVLEEKAFSETSKNLLLGILYKIEASYNDYATVKKDAITKDKYINNLINIIENDCDNIIISQNAEEAEDNINDIVTVDKEKKEIISYPIERKLLYAIYKIHNKDIIINDKYEFISETLSNAINAGSNIDLVEVLRDFNGWSWITVNSEIEGIEYNLIYQIIRILIGKDTLAKIVKRKDETTDNLKILQEKLQEKMRKRKCIVFYRLFKKNIYIVGNKI